MDHPIVFRSSSTFEEYVRTYSADLIIPLGQRHHEIRSPFTIKFDHQLFHGMDPQSHPFLTHPSHKCQLDNQYRRRGKNKNCLMPSSPRKSIFRIFRKHTMPDAWSCISLKPVRIMRSTAVVLYLHAGGGLHQTDTCIDEVDQKEFSLAFAFLVSFSSLNILLVLSRIRLEISHTRLNHIRVIILKGCVSLSSTPRASSRS